MLFFFVVYSVKLKRREAGGGGSMGFQFLNIFLNVSSVGVSEHQTYFWKYLIWFSSSVIIKNIYKYKIFILIKVNFS